LCTPSEAVDRINAYKEAGADMINIALRAPWNEDALNAYLDEVIPAVKG
jgi:2-methylisocitrate lyase-like PEP mutase family enzyme